MEPRQSIFQPRYLRSRFFSRGQGITEFALIILGILILIFSVMQGASAVAAYDFVTYAARDAARFAMVRGSTSPTPATTTDVQNFVLAESQGMNPAVLTVTTTWNPNNSPGNTVSVRVAYSFAPVAHISSWATLSLSSTSQMVISQ